ncbi:uncharacterized protein LOC113657158 isoform X2 [Tachysurus fulvidraco]|uniref:uncharacterized protein LOC113657158 isoform X2 n=1 Tax=Tachysurus fulvidraco TaxID=1234273 RepID=UPI001FEF376B|nr:uncharacterized protein LOC113657158 isoform X2 [Tachysurus fulvidraco]
MAILIISSLLILVLLGVRTDESNLDCFPSMWVPRNTVWSARVTERLMINCTIYSEPNCWNNIAVSWCKLDMNKECIYLTHSTHTSTVWRNISESKRVLLLIFWEISLQDSGLYRCIILSPVHTMSHNINVNVTDIHIDYNAVSTETITEGSPVTPVTDITNTHLSSEKWLYVIYFSAFVFALILAVPLMCRGLKKFLEDEDTMTTVIYEEAEKFSVQD